MFTSKIEYWAISEKLSRRQIEGWTADDENDINQMTDEQRRAFMRFKANHLGWRNAQYYFGKLNVPIQGRILEMGAGIFWLSTYLSSYADVTEAAGIELSAERILAYRDIALEMFPEACPSKIRYIVGDFHALQLPDNSVDLVVCDAVLHHADNLVAMLREAWRVLKPRGHFVALREPTISHLRLKPPQFHARYPEEGTAYYYYVDGWRSAFLNGWYENIRICPFVEYGLLRKKYRTPWPVRKLLRAIDLRIPLRYYPKICIAAQKPPNPVLSD